MGKWHTTEYNEYVTGFADANQVEAYTSKNSFIDYSISGITKSGCAGGGLTTRSTTNARSDYISSGHSKSADNYSNIEYESNRISRAYADYSDGDDPTDPPGDVEWSSDDDTEDSGDSPDDDENPLEEDGDDDPSDQYQTASASGGNTIKYTEGGKAGVDSAAHRETTSVVTNGVTAVTSAVATDPGYSSRDVYSAWRSRSGGTTATPADGNGGWQVTSSGITGGGNTGFTIQDGIPALNATNRTKYKTLGDLPEEFSGSVSHESWSSSTYAMFLSVKSTGSTITRAAKVDPSDQHWGRTDNGYSFVVFIDNPTFYGPSTVNVPAEEGSYMTSDSGNTPEDVLLETTQKIVMRRSDDAGYPDYEDEGEGEDDDSTGLSDEELNGSFDEGDNDDGDEDDEDVWSSMEVKTYYGTSEVSTESGTSEFRGFSYGTKTVESYYYIGGSGVAYVATAIDYGNDEGDDFCGNIDITKEVVQSATENPNWFFNTANLRTVFSETRYAIGGKVGIRAIESYNGNNYSGNTVMGPNKYGTSASIKSPLFNAKIVPGSSASKNVNRDYEVFVDNSGTYEVDTYSNQTRTYWTISYGSNSRETIRNFGIGGTAAIYNPFSTTREVNVFGGTEQREGRAQFSNDNETVDIPAQITSTFRGTTRDTRAYTGEYVFLGNDGMETKTSKRTIYENERMATITLSTPGAMNSVSVTYSRKKQYGFKAHAVVQNGGFIAFSQTADPYGIVHKTNTNIGNGTKELSPPVLNFTEEYLVASYTNGRTLWTVDERQDSHWSIPGQMASLLSKARFCPKQLAPVTIANGNGYLKASGNTLTQIQSVVLTGYPSDTSNTSIYTYYKELSRTIKVDGGLQNMQTYFSASSTADGVGGEFPASGGVFFGGGNGFDEPGTFNAIQGLMGTIFNDAGQTDLGYGQERTIKLDSGLNFYSHPEGAKSFVSQRQGFEYFSRDVDPYEDYYEC